MHTQMLSFEDSAIRNAGFSGDVGEGLLSALPQVLPISAAVGDPLHDVIAVLSRELAASEPGQQTVLDRLLDILVVLAIRTSFRTLRAMMAITAAPIP